MIARLPRRFTQLCSVLMVLNIALSSTYHTGCAQLAIFGGPEFILADTASNGITVRFNRLKATSAFGQKRTVAVRQARSSEPVGQLVPVGRRETTVLAKAQAGRGDVVFIFANQGGFAPAFKCCLSQKSLVLQNVLIDHIGAMAR